MKYIFNCLGLIFSPQTPSFPLYTMAVDGRCGGIRKDDCVLLLTTPSTTLMDLIPFFPYHCHRQGLLEDKIHENLNVLVAIWNEVRKGNGEAVAVLTVDGKLESVCREHLKEVTKIVKSKENV